MKKYAASKQDSLALFGIIQHSIYAARFNVAIRGFGLMIGIA
jgi:hypothetical protein